MGHLLRGRTARTPGARVTASEAVLAFGRVHLRARQLGREMTVPKPAESFNDFFARARSLDGRASQRISDDDAPGALRVTVRAAQPAPEARQGLVQRGADTNWQRRTRVRQHGTPSYCPLQVREPGRAPVRS
jgi:hypothetical protein